MHHTQLSLLLLLVFVLWAAVFTITGPMLSSSLGVPMFVVPQLVC